jgi:hypothetical protein
MISAIHAAVVFYRCARLFLRDNSRKGGGLVIELAALYDLNGRALSVDPREREICVPLISKPVSG